MVTRLPARIAVLCALLIPLAYQPAARAAASGQTGQAEKKVTLSLANSDIREALTLLFQSTGKSYTVSPSVKGTVTLSLIDIPFRIALTRLLASTDQPITYSLESGIYCIVPSTERSADAQAESDRDRGRIITIQLNFVSAGNLLKRFNSDLKSVLPSGIVPAASTDRSLVVRYTDEDDVRAFREIVRLFDVAPREIVIEAELVLSTGSLVKDRPIALIHATGRTASDKPITIKMNDRGSRADLAGLKLGKGSSSVRVTPLVMGDGAVALEASWNLNLDTSPGKGEPVVHLERTYTGSMRSGGNALKLTSSTVRLSDGRGKTVDGEIVLFLSARVLPDTVVLSSGDGRVAAEQVVRTAALDVSDHTGGTVSSNLASTLARELRATGRIEVAAEQVRTTADKLGLRQPYSAEAEERLLGALGASWVIQLDFNTVRGNPGASALIRVLDGSGISRSTTVTIANLSDTRAVRSGASAVVQWLLSYQTLMGTVLHISAGAERTALVNLGAKDGLRAGSELAVYRDSRRVGKLRITKVFASDSLARIVEGTAAIREEDDVRTVIPINSAAG